MLGPPATVTVCRVSAARLADGVHVPTVLQVILGDDEKAACAALGCTGSLKVMEMLLLRGTPLDPSGGLASVIVGGISSMEVSLELMAEPPLALVARIT